MFHVKTYWSFWKERIAFARSEKRKRTDCSRSL